MNEFDKLATEALQIAELAEEFSRPRMMDASVLEQARYAIPTRLFVRQCEDAGWGEWVIGDFVEALMRAIAFKSETIRNRGRIWTPPNE
jgi:hypothetical protein